MTSHTHPRGFASLKEEAMTDFDKVQHAMTKLLLEFRLNEADSFKDKVLPVLKTHLNNEFVLKLDYGTKVRKYFEVNVGPCIIDSFARPRIGSSLIPKGM